MPTSRPLATTLLCVALAVPCAAPALAGRFTPASIPFDLYDNHVWLAVAVNGSAPLDFLLDTGASAPLLDRDAATRAGVAPGRATDHGSVGTGEASVTLQAARDVRLDLHGVDVSAHTTYVMPLDGLMRVLGRRVDGVLGPELLRQRAVRIDYEHHEITLADPDSLPGVAAGDMIPLELRGGRPFVRATITLTAGAPVQGLFVIDVGDGSALSLHTPFVTRHQLLAAAWRTIGHYTHGLAGRSPERLGRIETLQLGHLVVRGPLTAFAQAERGSAADRSYDGAIGGEILRRFTVTFDYPHHRVFMQPNASFAEPFTPDMSGLSLVTGEAGGAAVEVEQVADESPATEAGIREGDRLEAIDGVAVSGHSLDEIRGLFRQEGRSFALRLKRDLETLEIHLRTRAPF